MKKLFVLSVSAALLLLLVALYENDVCAAIIGGSMFIGTSVLWSGTEDPGEVQKVKKYICKSCEKAWYSAAELRICPDCHEELKEEADAYLLEM